jgi:hypothetical protein
MYFKILPGLPHPPDWMIERIDMRYRPDMDLFSPTDAEYLSIDKTEDWQDQSYDWIKPMASNKNLRYRFNKEDENWMKQNITSEFEADNSGVMFFDYEQLPHTDTTRQYVLLYNIEAGGPDATLSFWQEEGYPIQRERGLAIDRGPHLTLLDQVTGPLRVWYILDTRTLHSVESVTERRTNLQLSFNTLPEEIAKLW